MKKYFVAAAVSVAVFAMSAFAASLTVSGGVLQSGVDRDLTCAENASVTYDHHSDYHHQAMDAWVEEFYVTFDDDCEGNVMWFVVEGPPVTGGGSPVLGGVAVEIGSNPVEIPVTNGSSWNNGVSIEDIVAVSVTVFSDVSNPGQEVGSSGFGFAGGIFADLSDTP